MENKYLITIDPTPQKIKPEGKDIGKINQNLAIVTGLTITEISKFLVQPYSYSWSPSIFDGKRSNSTWRQQEIFALDFDSGILPDEVIRRFGEFEIVPNLIYYTFSDSPMVRKFRIMLLVDQVVNQKELVSHIKKGLTALFPESDLMCRDYARMYFGGVGSDILNINPIPLEKLFVLVSMSQISGPKNKSMKSDKMRLLLYNIYRNTRDFRLIDTPETEAPNYLKKLNKNIFDFGKCSDSVKIFKDFIDGKWLRHPQLFGLATNLHWLNGGIKLMEETMKRYNQEGFTKYTENNFKILSYVKRMKYQPQKLENFSPYKEDHEFNNLISAVKEVRGHIEILEKRESVTLEEGKSLLREIFDDFLSRNSNKIYIVKVPTAIGKTELLTNLKQKVTLAFPTHDLIDEVSNRMKVEHILTPRIPIFSKGAINQKIDHLYSIGLYNKVFQLLKNIISEKKKNKYCEGDIELARHYLIDLSQSVTARETILTTHQRSLMTPYIHNTLIYDEDPIGSILEIKNLKVSDLFAIERTPELKDDINVLLNYLQEVPAGIVQQTPVFDIDPDNLINELVNNNISSNLLGFFKSAFFLKSKRNKNMVHYICRKNLPTDKKVIIMSASISINFYKRLYGERVEAFDLTNIKQQGQIVQHTSKSCSRTSLKNSTDEIIKKTKGAPTITFKQHTALFNEGGLNIYFGNCEGYDYLKGKDLNVVGTPHLNNIVYLLYASALGLEICTMDNVMSNQLVEWNGFRFKFQCYDNPDLREIQLSLIESDLIQAVGRARTLITDARVDLYSNFPLQISTKFEY